MSKNPDQVIIDLQNQQGGLDPQPHLNINYNPSKRKRAIRREVYQRYYWLRNDPLRVEAEVDWEIADKEYAMDIPTLDPDDWRSHLHLPDAFAAIQSQEQEMIERTTRPNLIGTEESDEPIAEFANSVMDYNMNNSGFDYQYALAKLSRAIRGTAFLMDYWRTEKRTVKDPTSVNPDGTIKYVAREIVDFDDDYTEWVPNEFIYIDDKAKHIDEAVDMFRREIINIEEFHRKYDNKPGFYDTEYVYAGGDTSTRSVYQLPKDITSQDVEVLHYYNRSTDAYWCVANNVAIYDAPLPTKHKELPIAVLYQYRMPGRFWGIGIPKIMYMLSQERTSLRNLNMDRQKLINAPVFMHNNSYEIDDEESQVVPGRIISVDTNGQSIQQAIEKIDFGEVPGSYFKTEEILLDDITRTTGINPLAEAQATGGTATQAAILKENTLKRINLVATMAEMDTILRIGRLKWSNIQLFYGTPRMEKITEDNDTRDEKQYRQISVQGKKFAIVDDQGSKALRMEDIKGNSALTLKPAYAKYLEGNFDISVNTDMHPPISKAIAQTKKQELFSLLIGNPATIATMDLPSAEADLLKENHIKSDIWLKSTVSSADMRMLAESEDMVMSAGQPLDATPEATEEHTLVHLMYTKTADFQALPHERQQLIMDHILAEHDANPATGSAADLLGQHGLAAGPPPPGSPGSPELPPGLPAPSLNAETSSPQAQPADISATNYAQPE